MKGRYFIIRVAFVTVFAFLIALRIAFAEVPAQMNLQGRLTDDLGGPVADGTYGMVFALYPTASGGSALWSEAQSVPVANGVYNVILGQPNSVFIDATPLLLP